MTLSVSVRKVVACPERTASEVWDFITEMLCHSSQEAAQQFKDVKGGVSSVISDEILENSAIVIKGTGPIVRIYCLYGDDAISGEDKKEEPINWELFKDGWKVYIPCIEEEIDSLKKYLEKKSNRFEVYNKNEKLSFNETKSSSIPDDTLFIDEEALKKL